MLSLKTASQGTSPGFHHHHPHHHGSPTSTTTASSSGSTSDTVDQTSCCSLVDAMSTAEASTSTASSSATNGTTGSSSSGLRRKPTMKSSYALTSMLQQQQQQQPQDDEEYTKHSNSSPTLSMIPDTTTTTLASAIVADAAAMTRMSPAEFGAALHAIEQPSSQDSSSPFTESQLRKALECPLRQARKLRDNCRGPGSQTSWIGLPYPSLREERPFLYDHMHTHPLAEILQRTLLLDNNTTDLAQLHQTWDSTQMTALAHQRQLVAPLLDKHERTQFAHAYESFVTSCCIPLLHAAALRHSVFSTSSAGVVYRYQVFPTINIVYPNDPEACRPPSCDLAHGKSVGWLHFHIPLTAACNTSALFCERYPGREDWHALRCTSVGLGYCWDGARCHSFVPLNTTNATRVSLDFRILLVRPDSLTSQEDDELCRPLHLTDSLTRIPGFYEQATMDVGGASRILLRRRSSPWSAVPDARCGFPFA